MATAPSARAEALQGPCLRHRKNRATTDAAARQTERGALVRGGEVRPAIASEGRNTAVDHGCVWPRMAIVPIGS